MENVPSYPPQNGQNSMSSLVRVVVIEAFVLVLVLGIVLGGLIYFNILSLPGNSTSNTAGNAANVPLPTTQSVGVNNFVDPNSKIVNSAVIFYELQDVRISEVKETGAKFSIHAADVPGLNIPELSVDKNTTIIVGKKDAPGESGSALNLNPEQKVRLAVSYNLKTSVWSVKNIYIEFESAAQPAPPVQ